MFYSLARGLRVKVDGHSGSVYLQYIAFHPIFCVGFESVGSGHLMGFVEICAEQRCIERHGGRTAS